MTIRSVRELNFLMLLKIKSSDSNVSVIQVLLTAVVQNLFHEIKTKITTSIWPHSTLSSKKNFPGENAVRRHSGGYDQFVRIRFGDLLVDVYFNTSALVLEPLCSSRNRWGAIQRISELAILAECGAYCRYYYSGSACTNSR